MSLVDDLIFSLENKLNMYNNLSICLFDLQLCDKKLQQSKLFITKHKNQCLRSTDHIIVCVVDGKIIILI